jgi:hypothetical protein
MCCGRMHWVKACGTGAGTDQASAEVRTETTACESSRATIPCNGEMTNGEGTG